MFLSSVTTIGGADTKFSFNRYLFVLTDILRHFSPNLTGYSLGIGKENTHQAFLNQAVTGAKSQWVMMEHTLASMQNERVNLYKMIKILVVKHIKKCCVIKI